MNLSNTLTAESIVDRFKFVFSALDRSSLDLLDDIYSNDAVFSDPFRTVSGLAQIKQYFKDLYINVKDSEFSFHGEIINGDNAAVFWTLHVEHPRLNKGERYEVEGNSLIQFGQKITYHRDYFDGGQMLYEQVPFIGFLVRRLKARL